jgi:phosphoribosylglycinamide formyltransferase 2
LAADAMMISPAAARVLKPAVSAADALTDALAVPESDIRVFERPGGSKSAGAPRSLGVALATAPDVATARDRAREAARRLNMRDSRG